MEHAAKVPRLHLSWSGVMIEASATRGLVRVHASSGDGCRCRCRSLYTPELAGQVECSTLRPHKKNFKADNNPRRRREYKQSKQCYDTPKHEGNASFSKALMLFQPSFTTLMNRDLMGNSQYRKPLGTLKRI